MGMNDLLGVKPVAEAGKEVVQASLDGVRAFLGATCMPMLEELGQMARDEVRYWRLNNILRIVRKAEERLEFDGQQLQLKANARVGLEIAEHGSRIDDDELQELWAGLFASSCTEDGKDDTNLSFVNMLRQVSKSQAGLIKYVCNTATVARFETGLVMACRTEYEVADLLAAGGYCPKEGLNRLDVDLDYLRNLGLFDGGLAANDVDLADINPTPYCLNLYVRCMSVDKYPGNFWPDDKYVSREEYQKRPGVGDMIDI